MHSSDVLQMLTLNSFACRLFGMVIEKLFVAEVQKVSGTTERKICAVGMTKMLCEAPVMMGSDYIALW